MSSRFKTYTVIWLIILSIISGAALCRSFYMDVDLGFDYIGIIVGILAALCTVLIGWQIYILVDLRSVDKRFEVIEDKHNLDNLRTALQIYESVSTLTTQLATQPTAEELIPQSIMFELLCIVTQSKLEQYDMCNYEIANMVQTPSDGLEVMASDKNRYIKILSEINCPDKIKEYPALVSWIATLHVLPSH